MTEEAFAKIAIIGTGLIGASFGLACIHRGLGKEVVGFDLSEGRAHEAKQIGAVTKVAADLREAVTGADLIILAAPVGEIPSIFREAVPYFSGGSIVTDVGSVKSRIVKEISAVCPPGISFIGGHPVAGSEQEGLGAASKDLFDGAFWIMTPVEDSDPKSYQRLVRLLGRLGARVISLDPARHDEAVALTSHLPQLISTTLMGFADEISSGKDGVPLFAAGGFRDMTRIAASPAGLWVDIIRDNKEAVQRMTDRFLQALSEASEDLRAERWDHLRASLAAAADARRALPSKPGIKPAEVVELLVPVPDQPGVLAEIATTVGESGVNIEDIDIVHSLEGGRGTIRIVVNGSSAAKKALEAIKARGFAVEILEQ